MGGNGEKDLREQQVRSYGQLLASFSHELKNHLGIIRESAGLIADLVEIHAAQMDLGLVTRIEKNTAFIEGRVVIAAQLFHHLSNFAHRSDNACGSVDIIQLCEEAVALFARHARMKQVVLTVMPSVELPVLYTSPSLLHHLLFLLLRRGIDQLEPGASLVISSARYADGILLNFTVEGTALTINNSDDSDLQMALDALRGHLVVENGTLALYLSSLPENK